MPGHYHPIRITGSLFVFCLVFLAGSAVSGQEKEQPPQVLPETKVTAPKAGTPEPVPQPELPPAPQPPAFDPLTTSGRTLPVQNNIGGFLAPSQGRVTQFDIAPEAFLRPAQILESIPGLVVTQHSGSGKANQYFLRGFNLDHGTDFAGFLEGVPWNLPTSAHGQGYLDFNSLIPELVETVDFYKGPYFAQLGDFATAGAAQIQYVSRLEQGIFRQEVGMYDWYRTLVANSGDFAGGTLLYAFEGVYYNGPWDFGENFRKFNGFIKYSRGDAENGLSWTTLGYSGVWRSTDQIPLRAVGTLIDRFGTIDPTDGGSTRRLTTVGQWWHTDEVYGTTTRASVYGAYYALDLFNNFTFFLDDPVFGDQFLQSEHRFYSGFDVSHQWRSWVFGEDVQHRVGVQLRNDNIPSVALTHTSQRIPVSVTRQDAVNQNLSSIYYVNETKWCEKVRTVLGLRGDYYSFNVDSESDPANTGDTFARRLSPKASLIFGPFEQTDIYLSGGYGFHSNDARGTVQSVDPVTGEPVSRVPGLVPARGAEVGFRSQAIPDLTTAMALWYLRLASELVFVGDAGTTEPNRASERYGLEWTNTYQFNQYVSMDADFAFSHARFLGTDPETPGNHIPLSVGTVISAGPVVRLPSGWFGSLRMRHFGGARPLVEDNSVSAAATTSFDMLVGYERPNFSLGMSFLNLFNSNDHDIDYFYETQLRGEAAPVADLNFHPLEPFNLRMWMNWKF
ncbi:MAG: TonB-dependent receptor plug domain-containing protein [Planctomycetia bacterium]|nr:TonB-dependent receptor plug domain-containing protein [Planctomycetia bacterium]